MDHHLIPQRVAQELLQPHDVTLGQLARGGLSGARVWQADSRHGQVALRCWAPGHPTPERLGQQHAAMRRACQRGETCVPRVYSTLTGNSFCQVGQQLWELTQWMPGQADYLQRPSLDRLQAALEQLGRLHRVWSRDSPQLAGTSPTARDRYQRLQRWLAQLAALRGLPSRRSDPLGDGPGTLIPQLAEETLWQLAHRGPQLLTELRPLVDQRVGLHFVIRDIWSEHVLFTEHRVTGIIDFGAARIDEPAADVARLLGSLEPRDQTRWLTGWQAYHGVQRLVELQRVQVLDRVGGLLAAAQWLEWLVLERRQFAAPLHQLTERWQHLLQRLEYWDRLG